MFPDYLSVSYDYGYILFDQVWWCNVKQFLSKFTCANLCKSVDDIINYSTSICFFESGNCGKGKNQKTWISRERKELLK